MKNKKNITIIISVFLAILFVAICFYVHYLHSSISIDGHIFSVEVVTSDADMQKGLGDRDNLCKNCGMLFQFSEPAKYAFWMKDMRFPLDILWISQGKITYIEKNVPFTSAAIMAPTRAADHVLEINAGNVDGYGFKVGDSIKF